MKITTSSKSLGEISEDALIVPIFEGETPSDSETALAALNHLTRGAIASLFEDGEIDGKRDRCVLLHNVGDFSTKRLLLCGAGDPERSEERRVGKECRSRWSP